MSGIPEYLRGLSNGRTAAQIQEILRSKDPVQLTDELAVLMDLAAQGECHQDLIDAYLSILDEKDPLSFEINAEDALEQFQERHAVLLREVQRGAVPHRGRSILRKLIPAVAAIALALGCMVTAQAFGVDVFGAIARWTDNTFRFGDPSEPFAEITKMPLKDGESAKYESLHEAVDAFGITAPIVPNTLPERFELTNVEAFYEGGNVLIIGDYYSDDGYFFVSYRDGTVNMEKDDDPAEAYRYGGIDHYLFTNTHNYVAAWENGQFTCAMYGTVTKNELQDIIESIYEE